MSLKRLGFSERKFTLRKAIVYISTRFTVATPTAELRPPVDGDLVRSYLRDIGRVPLLSHEQEITLGRQVQELVRIE